MPVHPNRAIQGLPLMTWRGLRSPPYDTASFSFSHQQAEKRFPYIDGAAHDWTGMDPIPFDFQLYFLNSLEPRLFPDLWERWRVALFDGSPGELRHPLVGVVDAVVQGGDVKLVAQATAGIVVSVKFTQTILDPSEKVQFDALEVGLKALAQQADEWGQAVDVPFPDGELATSFEDLVGQIESAIGLAKMQAIALINKALGTVATVIKTVKALESHVTWPYTGALISLYNGLLDLRAEVGANKARATTSVTYPTLVTVEQVAADHGNTVGEVMQLNLQLLRRPTIEAGTAIRVYR